MDEMDGIFWRLVSDVLVSIELEFNLVQDLLTGKWHGLVYFILWALAGYSVPPML